MNIWDWALLGLGWIVALIVLFLLAIVLFIGISTLIHVVRRSLPFKPKRPLQQPKPTAALDDYLAEATIVGRSMYGISPNPSLEAFRAGARWGWGFFHR